MRCTCREFTVAVHRDDLGKPIKEQRRICLHLLRFYAQYVDGLKDWIVFHPENVTL